MLRVYVSGLKLKMKLDLDKELLKLHSTKNIRLLDINTQQLYEINQIYRTLTILPPTNLTSN